MAGDNLMPNLDQEVAKGRGDDHQMESTKDKHQMEFAKDEHQMEFAKDKRQGKVPWLTVRSKDRRSF